MPDKPIQSTSKTKDSFMTAAIAAGIVLVILLIVWIPFKLIPALFSNGSNFVATTLTSTFIPDNKATTTTQTTQNTQNTQSTQNTQATQTTQTTQTNTVATPATKIVYVQTPQTYYGRPDLAVRFIATGIIDPATKQFMQTNYAGQNDTVAIKFDVKNVGTNVSGPWSLRLNMPSRTTPYFDSGLQPSIKPNDRIEFIASFDSPLTQGINTGYITADPLNVIPELNESNNSLTVPMNISGTTYSYNNNYNYGSTAYGAYLPYGSLYTWSNISANCYANPQTTYPGNTITWFVSASGGNGYFTYSWTGSDGLYGTNSFVSQTYTSSGPKTATVSITSGGQTITKQCNALVY